ncbi:high frequency lysogenization protein HflD [Thiomicrorhabdus immobilis]|uniref:High frequency lysogenization protein HflD homolog n=1 Tax=Thiomicrorhabdus immobilis TaxID=2791037 RepID=A0ABN6CX06_9GAMM|nr:high frequency lysogenization protein HflD [Thiomicrorhabdus immobilis]BCN93239.1 high frequency lysogenization protein HflD [Thiomicrorhabdus immobilis]
MSQYTQQDRTIALIGIYQCSQLVYELATTGKADELAYKTSINSLFVENPKDTLGVYGDDVENIQLGVNTLLAQMSSDQAIQNRNIEITRYVLNLMILAKKLKELEAPLEHIFGILETAKLQTEQFGELHENVIATIARAYSENVSVVSPRIMVNGQHGHLQNPRTANKIRALLLAGVRSALLWYQVEGSRWGLIWSRKKYLQSAQALHRPKNDDSSRYFDTDN